MTKTQQLWAVVPAAGVGSRFSSDRPKQYTRLGARTILDHTISVLLTHPRVAGVVVAIAAGDHNWRSSEFVGSSKIRMVEGGAERSDSVLNGLRYLRDAEPKIRSVMVHDAARPCLQHTDIDRLLDEGIESHAGAILAAPAKDTLKEVTVEGKILTTIDRSALWHALTPQLFPLSTLVSALETAANKKQPITDEASAMELMGESPKVVLGQTTNLKITVPEDLILAEAILRSQGRLDS